MGSHGCGARAPGLRAVPGALLRWGGRDGGATHEPVLNLFQRHAFGFGHHQLHPEKLQDHHAGEEQEDVARREFLDQGRKDAREQGGKDPVVKLPSA